jgi:hypothetical protein
MAFSHQSICNRSVVGTSPQARLEAALGDAAAAAALQALAPLQQGLQPGDAMADSPLDPARLRQARALLAARPAAEGPAGVAAAATFFVLSALGLAMTVVLMPPPWQH